MNWPIRAIGIVTTIVWILLIAILAILAYSIAGLGYAVRSPSVNVTQNQSIVVSMPIQINNGGFMDLNDLNITTVLKDVENEQISKTSSFVPLIRRNSNSSLIHNVTLNAETFAKKVEKYLFFDSNFTFFLFGDINVAGILPSSLETNFTYPWGAPLYNFSLSVPKISANNNTHFQIEIPMSFVNHAQFDVKGTLRASIYDGNDVLRGKTLTDFEALSGNTYNNKFNFFVPVDENIITGWNGGYVDLSFSGEFGNFGPWRIPFD